MKKVILLLFLVVVLTSQSFATGDSLLFFEQRVQWRLGAVYDATTFPDSILDGFINYRCSLGFPILPP